jgi:hypothetical protein
LTESFGAASAPERRPRREFAGASLLYVALALLFTASVWNNPTERWIGACCDQEQSIWYIAWVPAAIEHGQNPLLTAQLNAPDGANLMWNTAEPVLSLLAAPVTLTAGPILAYNLTVLFAIALSGLACFVALRRHARRALGPLVAGALYAFSPYIASHTVLHVSLLSAWAPPLFLLLFDELLVRRDRRPEILGALVGIVGAIQLLTSEEVLATSGVAAGLLGLVIALVVRDRGQIRVAAGRAARAFVPALAAFLLIGGFPLAVQFLGPQQILASVTNPSLFSTDLLNLVLPTPYTLIAPSAATAISTHFSGLYHEATGYVGVPLLLLCAWVVVARRQDPRVVAAATMAVVMFVLSLGPELHLDDSSTGIPMPWLVLSKLPLLGHVVPGRLTLYMWLAIAGLVAVAIDHALDQRPRAAAIRLAAVALALLFVVPAPQHTSTAQVPEFFRSWNEQGIAATDTILAAPWFTNGAGADPMLWAAIAGAQPRLHEGYLFVPDDQGRPHYGPPRGVLADMMVEIQDTGASVQARGSERRQSLAELRADEISVVLVGSMRYRSQMVAFFTDLLGVAPTDSQGVALWRDVPALVSSQP